MDHNLTCEMSLPSSGHWFTGYINGNCFTENANIHMSFNKPHNYLSTCWAALGRSDRGAFSWISVKSGSRSNGAGLLSFKVVKASVSPCPSSKSCRIQGFLCRANIGRTSCFILPPCYGNRTATIVVDENMLLQDYISISAERVIGY